MCRSEKYFEVYARQNSPYPCTIQPKVGNTRPIPFPSESLSFPTKKSPIKFFLCPAPSLPAGIGAMSGILIKDHDFLKNHLKIRKTRRGGGAISLKKLWETKGKQGTEKQGSDFLENRGTKSGTGDREKTGQLLEWKQERKPKQNHE